VGISLSIYEEHNGKKNKNNEKDQKQQQIEILCGVIKKNPEKFWNQPTQNQYNDDNNNSNNKDLVFYKKGAFESSKNGNEESSSEETKAKGKKKDDEDDNGRDQLAKAKCDGDNDGNNDDENNQSTQHFKQDCKTLTIVRDLLGSSIQELMTLPSNKNEERSKNNVNGYLMDIDDTDDIDDGNKKKQRQR